MTTPLDELRLALSKATVDLNQLSGVACEHGWDTHVCPIKGCGPDPEEARDQIVAALPQLLDLAAIGQKLNELLCVIHRDGGHYIDEHGEAKAYEDALRISSERIVDAHLGLLVQEAASEVVEKLARAIFHEYWADKYPFPDAGTPEYDEDMRIARAVLRTLEGLVK